MSSTNGAAPGCRNATLKAQGGDIYVGIMTVLNSVREVVMLPVNGLTSAFQPVLGYNYGAKEYSRIKQGIRFITVVCIAYTLAAWFLIFLFPDVFIRVFNSEPELITKGIPAMHLYFFGFFMMGPPVCRPVHLCGNGQTKYAVFFSLFRKIVIVVPLTLLLPHVAGLGVKGVFLAEPISNFFGGLACYITMNLVVGRIVKEKR